MVHRDYMRTAPRPHDDFPMLRIMLTINIVCFMMQMFVQGWFRVPMLIETAGLSVENLRQGYLWSIGTYSFLHGGLLHALINILVLFFIGKEVEPRLGSKAFLKLYVGCLLAGGLFWLVVAGFKGGVLVGASAAVYGILIYFCLMEPYRPITLLLFFIIPITVKPIILFWVLLCLETFLFLSMELSGQSNVASSAHLGGMLGAIAFYRYFNRSWGPLEKYLGYPKQAMAKQRKSVTPSRFKVNVTNKAELKKRVDKILDKINKDGFGALSEEEKQLLDEAKELLK